MPDISGHALIYRSPISKQHLRVLQRITTAARAESGEHKVDLFDSDVPVAQDTAAFALYSVSRSASLYQCAGRGNAPRPITSVFTPSPVKHTPSAIFSL